MQFSLIFSDISLLLAINAIILLVTTELLSTYYSHVNLTINMKRLKNAALATSVLFLVTAAIKIITVITAS